MTTMRDWSILDRPERLYTVRRVLRILQERTEIFDLFASVAAASAEAPIALISVIDHEAQWFAGRFGTELEGTAREVALCSHVAADQDELHVGDARTDPTFADNPLVVGEFGLRSYAGTPLIVGGHEVGAVCVIDSVPRDFDERCVQVLRALAQSVAATIEDRLAGASADDSSGSRDDPPLALRQQIITAINQAVVVTDLENQVIWANSATGRVFGADAMAGTFLGDADPVATGANGSERRLRQRITPLIDPVHGDVAGTIRSYVDITDGEMERQRLEHLVNTESLTGMANRRSFQAHLRRAIESNERSPSPNSVVIGILDLDRFKAINDQLGHAIGDQVLVEVAEIMKSHIGKNDVVARIGGDEFAFVLTDGEASSNRIVQQILRSIRRAVERHSDARANLSASIGLTVLRDEDRAPGDVLRRADLACYEAKQSGGNRSQRHH